MNKATIKSFVKEFVAIVKGDSAEQQAEKVFRQAQSALQTQIATLNGDTISLEDAVSDAKENLAKSRINFGNTISDRNNYVSQLVDAKNALSNAEADLEEHLETLAFLKSELQNLEKTEEVND